MRVRQVSARSSYESVDRGHREIVKFDDFGFSEIDERR